ncbi:hypothetical protein TSUD_117710 [Trifolium subterraneum]|nr:hypothetical protein TSUD_117710 [Trifolium subterraneum]
MMEQFCRDTKDPLLLMLHKMDDKSLITEVRQYLQHKRYLIFFDDVWQEDFSDQVEFAMPNNNNGNSRIIITTRMMQVSEFFKKSFLVHVHNLQLLPPEKAWELFCKKVFRFEFDGQCPPDLEAISKDIVRKCKQLPLAIVAIGGLLSTKSKTMIEWKNVSENLSLELGRNAHLTSLTKILSLSYDGLPYYLKPCILYFGIYPENYFINHKRLTRQWIAEGFVKSDEGRTPEQVANEYLSELIHRSLVQVSNVGFEGKVQTCQVHDLLWEVIVRKMKELIKDLKVLDIQGASLNHIPNNLENLFHLRYINLRGTKVKALPKSVGELQHLETLDLRDTLVHHLPSEINKLTKLRHLLVFHRNYEAKYSLLGFTTGVLMEKGIKNLTSLQNLYYVEVDHGGVDLIQEMKMLTQLRRIGLRHVRREHGNALSAALVEMKHLENLNITTVVEDETINLNFVSSPPQLQRLHLKARLDILPDWIPKLEFLNLASFLQFFLIPYLASITMSVDSNASVHGANHHGGHIGTSSQGHNKGYQNDTLNPYFLHPNENPGLILVNPPLSGSNYHSWSRAMTMALKSKNKLRFVNGSLPRPHDDDHDSLAWDRCNTMIISWLTNAVEAEISHSQSNRGRGSRGGGRSSGGRGKGNKLCTFCGQTNHIVDDCWKKYGYPPHMQHLQNNHRAVNNIANAHGEDDEVHTVTCEEDNIESETGKLFFTPAQHKTLLALLQGSQSLPSHSINHVTTNSVFSMHQKNFTNQSKIT